MIDPDGVVQGFEVLTPPVGRNIGETIWQVQAFQLVRESKGKEVSCGFESHMVREFCQSNNNQLLDTKRNFCEG